MKLKAVIALVVALLASFAVTGCGNAVNNVMSEIDDLGEITLDSLSALEAVNSDYEALDDEQRDQVTNYSVLEDANSRMNEILYAEIKKKIEKLESLESSYFAQYYDMNSIDSVKKEATDALESSSTADYPEIYNSLESEISSFNEYVEAETAQSYSVQTNDGDYPFAVDESEIQYHYGMVSFEKRSSDYPSSPCFFDADTTDEPAIFSFDCKKKSCEYACKFSTVETRGIDVQDEDGELKKAFVNTEVILSKPPASWGSGNRGLYSLGKESCYLFQSDEYGLMLAVKDLVKKDGYILYHW